MMPSHHRKYRRQDQAYGSERRLVKRSVTSATLQKEYESGVGVYSPQYVDGIRDPGFGVEDPIVFALIKIVRRDVRQPVGATLTALQKSLVMRIQHVGPVQVG